MSNIDFHHTSVPSLSKVAKEYLIRVCPALPLFWYTLHKYVNFDTRTYNASVDKDDTRDQVIDRKNRSQCFVFLK